VIRRSLDAVLLKKQIGGAGYPMLSRLMKQLKQSVLLLLLLGWVCTSTIFDFSLAAAAAKELSSRK